MLFISASVMASFSRFPAAFSGDTPFALPTAVMMVVVVVGGVVAGEVVDAGPAGSFHRSLSRRPRPRRSDIIGSGGGGSGSRRNCCSVPVRRLVAVTADAANRGDATVRPIEGAGKNRR